MMTDVGPHMTSPASELLRRGKVFEEVAGRLRRWIESELHAGDRLPPERELVARFGVSRSSIRDAMHRLQQEGYVETRHGVGSVVAAPAQRAAVNPITAALKGRATVIGELMDFRKMVEPTVAARAAERATSEEIANLQAILDRQAIKLDHNTPAALEDAQFHDAIAVGARNSVMVKVFDTLMHLLAETRREQWQSPDRARQSLAGHHEILEAIRRRHPADAAAAMQRHLDEVEAIIETQQGSNL